MKLFQNTAPLTVAGMGYAVWYMFLNRCSQTGMNIFLSAGIIGLTGITLVFGAALVQWFFGTPMNVSAAGVRLAIYGGFFLNFSDALLLRGSRGIPLTQAALICNTIILVSTVLIGKFVQHDVLSTKQTLGIANAMITIYLLTAK